MNSDQDPANVASCLMRLAVSNYFFWQTKNSQDYLIHLNSRWIQSAVFDFATNLLVGIDCGTEPNRPS